jgi:hypothetical protein
LFDAVRLFPSPVLDFAQLQIARVAEPSPLSESSNAEDVEAKAGRELEFAVLADRILKLLDLSISG